MSVYESVAFVENDDDPSGTAQALLEAAEAAGMPASVVRVAPGYDGFYVPQSLGDDPDDPLGNLPYSPSDGYADSPATEAAYVPSYGDPTGTARALLEAAEAAGLPASVVRVAPGFDGYFVPEDLQVEVTGLVITEPADGAEVDPLVTIRGRGAPADSTVDLYMDSAWDGQEPVSSVTADSSGAFEFVGSTPLEVSPEGIAVGVGETRSPKVTVTLAAARTTTTKKKGTAG
jgi:hypothetical protein